MSLSPGQYRKSPYYPLFQFLWRICPILAPFAKIRQNCISYKRHQRPLNRAGFCHLFYPIRGPERPPERDYEGLFLRRRFQKTGNVGNGRETPYLDWKLLEYKNNNITKYLKKVIIDYGNVYKDNVS
jgi:hypothetical protein